MHPAEFVSGRKAQVIGGDLSRTELKLLAMTQKVRVLALPGQSIRYHAGDLAQVAESRRAAAGVNPAAVA
jgi:hypothetical protein